VFAPGNLRAVADNAAYKHLVDYWVMNGYTLRYTGNLLWKNNLTKVAWCQTFTNYLLKNKVFLQI
jgi:hypothetical protein